MASMMERMRRVLRSGPRGAMWTLVVQGVAVGAQLAVDLGLARLLGPALLGEVIFALSVSGLVSVLLLGGTGEVAIQLHARRGAAAVGQVVRAELAVWLVGGLVCGALMAGIGWAFEVSGVGAWAMLGGWMALMAQGVASVLNQPILAHGLSRREVRWVVGSRLLLVALALVAGWSGQPLGVLGAMAISALVLALGRARVIQAHVGPLGGVGGEREVLGVLWRRGRMIGLGAVFGTISNRADMLALRGWCAMEAVGSYGALYRLVSGVQLIHTALVLALYPGLVRGEQGVRRAWPLLGAAGVVGALGVAAVAPLEQVPVWLFGEAWAGMGGVTQLLCVAAGLQWGSAFGMRWVVSIGREAWLPGAQALAALVNVGLLVALVPGRGVEGAALATVCAEAALLAVVVWASAQPARMEVRDADAAAV
jgi:O-antigen/teichoic acid export membrane protein